HGGHPMAWLRIARSFLAGALALGLVVLPAIGRPPQGYGPGAAHRSIDASNLLWKPAGEQFYTLQTENNYGSNSGQSVRYCQTTPRPISRFSLFLPGRLYANGKEQNGYNETYFSGAIEYPVGAGALPLPIFSVNGQSLIAIDPASTGTTTDPIAVNI